MRPRTPSSRQGSALLLALWSLILLSMSVFGVVEIVQASVSHSAHLELESQARALARSGLALAIDPEMATRDSLLVQQPEPGQKWSVTMTGEASRLNLNFILSQGHPEVLERFFVGWGLKDSDAAQVAACLYDWVTPGNNASPLGAKQADYQRAGLTRFPTGQPFKSLQEVLSVMHMDEVEKIKPDWQNSFTLWSDGPIDINEAPAEILAAVFNVPLSQAQAFVTTRNGKDGIQGTDDDVLVNDTPTLKAAFGLSTKDLNSLLSQINYTDAVRRLKSKGEAGGVAVTISAVTRLRSSPPEFILWTEL